MTSTVSITALALVAIASAGCSSGDPEMASLPCVENFEEIAEGAFMGRQARGTATLVFTIQQQTDAARAKLYRDWRLTQAPVETVTGNTEYVRREREEFLRSNTPVPAIMIADEHMVRVAGPTGTGKGIVERACAMQRPGVRLKQITVGVVGPDGGDTLREMVP